MPLAKARTGDHAWTPPASGASELLQASLPGAGRRRTAPEVAGNNAEFASLARTAAPRACTSPRRMVGQPGMSHREPLYSRSAQGMELALHMHDDRLESTRCEVC